MASSSTPPDTKLPVHADNEIIALDAVSIMAAIRERRLSCREVMTAHLARIEAVNGFYNAIVSLRSANELLAEADAADADLAGGRWRGPLHGLPHAVKDLTATRGLRTTYGSPLFADFVPTHDALCVERMRAAGAIIVGKTNVPEFGLGSQSFNPVFGATRNAFDPDVTAGGSSGGAAVALALHMLPLADGSDFGGSLRNPAGWNGVFGYRPSIGRVPSLPEPEGFIQQLSTDGPMARTVADLSLLLSVMSGYDQRAPLAISEPPLPAALLDGGVHGRRIGWLGDLDGAVATEPGILALCEEALSAFGAAGCVVEPALLGMPAERIWSCWLVWRHALNAGKFAAIYADPAKRAMLKPEQIWEIEGGLKLTVVDLFKASAERTAVRAAFLKLFERYDALALPSAQCFPFPLDEHWPKEVGGRRMDTYSRWMEIMFGVTLSGCPAIAMPAGFGGANRLPSGLQLVGRPGGDRELLRLAKAYEDVNQPLGRLPALS